MFFKKDKKKEKVLCIDFGVRLTKLFLFRRKANKVILEDFVKVDNYDSEGNSLSGEAYAELIDSAIKKLKADKASVRISLSNEETVVRYIDVPEMSKFELTSSIKYQAENYVPFDLDTVYYDCHILSVADKKMKVVIVAIKKDQVDKTLELLKQLKIKPDSMEVNSISLINSLQFVMGDDYSKNMMAVVDVGSSKINTNIINKGVPVLSREAKEGNNQINLNIMKGLICSFQESEESKLKRDANVENHFTTHFSHATKAISTSLTFFEGYSHDRVKTIFISGGSVFIPGIIAAVKEAIPAEVENLEEKIREKIDMSNDVQSKVENVALSIGVGLVVGENQ